ncbi:MAG: M56 family metallopeptidase [Lachnospiraceae bacterium]|nr:M56 family metallopeptidase [Lachnospiraceae bacterium]
MNDVLKIILSLSLSGSLLILALLLGKRFLRDKLSRQWQYYIWLIVILRLLLPFSPKISLMNLMEKTYQTIDQFVTKSTPSTRGQSTSPAVKSIYLSIPANIPGHDIKQAGEPLTLPHPLGNMVSSLTRHIWVIWLLAAVGILIRKVTIYQSFIRYINTGRIPVSDIKMLDALYVASKRAGVKKPVELCVNPLISSPLLTGFFHPCIVLPDADISETDFLYIAMHELTHYKRKDIFYKWLVQITVCLHWFNPLVHLMAGEINKACEFSCDEAVLTKTGCDGALDYGKTLLDAMAAIRKYKKNPGVVSLSENKQLLKERLGAIMNFHKQSRAAHFLTGVLTLCILFASAFIGVYPVATVTGATSKTTSQTDDTTPEYIKDTIPETPNDDTGESDGSEGKKTRVKNWNWDQWNEIWDYWDDEDWDYWHKEEW